MRAALPNAFALEEHAVDKAMDGPLRPKYDCTNQATENVLWVVA
jgi:hypothetical protein